MSPENDDQKDQSPAKQAGDTSVMAEEIKTLARRGAFREAETLRQKLLESDPMALSAIVSTAEVIEEEKTKNVDQDHLAIWSELYEGFSKEEINSLFYSFHPATVKTGKLLQVQGKPNNRLFFIESGRVTVFYHQNGKNVPIIQLGRGDVLGEETFFGISLSSVSAATQSDVSLRYLKEKEALCWHESQPGLFEKLADFCRRVGKSEAAATRKNLERRKYPRYPATGSVTAYLLDGKKNRTATYFKGALTDISRIGLCFMMKCSKQETARALLCRDVDLTVSFDKAPETVLETGASIVKLSSYLHGDYSTHVRLGTIITEDIFNTLPCDWSSPEQTD